MTRFKIIRIYVVEAASKPDVWTWIHGTKPEEKEQFLDSQFVKEIEDPGFVRSLVRQITGK